MLTMIVPMYISEVSTPAIRGTLVVFQQRGFSLLRCFLFRPFSLPQTPGQCLCSQILLVSITLGILISYWLEYGTQFIGGTRCAPDIPYSGGTPSAPTFHPIRDVGPNGCTGQSEAAWRIPFAIQIVPALVLGIGMIFYPESPRYFLMRHDEDKAVKALAKLRRMDPESDSLRHEYLAIKAEVLFDETMAKEKFPGKSGVTLFFAQYYDLFSNKATFRRLFIGSATMFFQVSRPPTLLSNPRESNTALTALVF
jgi:hypothetical protein